MKYKKNSSFNKNDENYQSDNGKIQKETVVTKDPDEKGNSASEQNEKDMKEKTGKAKDKIDEIVRKETKGLDKVFSNSESIRKNYKAHLNKKLKKNQAAEQKEKDKGDGPSR